MRVCIGGTFNPLHDGHKMLIRTACKLAGLNGSVYIGITSGNNFSKKDMVPSFYKRKKIIQHYLSEEKINTTVCIRPLKDKFGPSITKDFDAIVVSPETKKTAEEINIIRMQRKKKPLQIIEIPFVLADDHKPISSTRIRKGEIDNRGCLL